MKIKYVVKAVIVISMAVLIAFAFGVTQAPVQQIARLEEQPVEIEVIEDNTAVDSSELLRETKGATGFGTAQVSTQETQQDSTEEDIPYYNNPDFYTDNEAGIDVPTDNMGDDGTNYSEEPNGLYADGYDVPNCAIDPRSYSGKIYGTPSRGTEGGYSPVPHLITKVPNVVGMQWDEAKRVLKKSGLVAGQNQWEPYFQNSSLPKGTIISQNIPPGSYAWLESYISTPVSNGLIAITVPDVIGMNVEEAKIVLTKAGFIKIIVNKTYDPNKENGMIWQQYPYSYNPGEYWEFDPNEASITLSVYHNNSEVDFGNPKVVGMHYEDAVDYFFQFFSNISVKYEYHADYLEGICFKYEVPGAVGSIASVTAEPILYISNGPNPNATPTLTPVPTPEQTPEPTPEQTPEPTPEQTPEPTPEQTPESTPEPTPEQIPENTPEPTPEGE